MDKRKRVAAEPRTTSGGLPIRDNVATDAAKSDGVDGRGVDGWQMEPPGDVERRLNVRSWNRRGGGRVTVWGARAGRRWEDHRVVVCAWVDGDALAVSVHAPEDARALLRLLGMPPLPEEVERRWGGWNDDEAVDGGATGGAGANGGGAAEAGRRDAAGAGDSGGRLGSGRDDGGRVRHGGGVASHLDAPGVVAGAIAPLADSTGLGRAERSGGGGPGVSTVGPVAGAGMETERGGLNEWDRVAATLVGRAVLQAYRCVPLIPADEEEAEESRRHRHRCTCTGPARDAHDKTCPVRIANPRKDLGDTDEEQRPGEADMPGRAS